MVIYMTVNLVTGKWYIGKDSVNNPAYLGSGVLLKQAIKKHGKSNFQKIVLEQCNGLSHLADREKHWIELTNAATGPESYNLAGGGEGGDLSKFIDYDNRRQPPDPFRQARQWFSSLSEAGREEWFAKQARNRSKGWFVSRVDDPEEVFVLNIAQWCRSNNVDTSMPTKLNTPGHQLFQKQTKGWRIRRSDMPELPEYVSRRGAPHDNGCLGKSWKLVNGTRVWGPKQEKGER